MPDKQTVEAINRAFYNLSQSSAQLYDFWLSELYDLRGEPIFSAWNSHNLRLMEADVLNILA